MIKKRATITTPGYKGGSTAPRPISGSPRPSVSKTTGPKVAPRTGAKVTKPISGGKGSAVTTPGFKPVTKKKTY